MYKKMQDKKKNIVLLGAIDGNHLDDVERLVKTLEQMAEAFGEGRQCCVSREISKLHEEHRRGTIAEVLSHFKECEPKGEIVLVVAGAPELKKEHKNKYKDYSDDETEEQ